MVVVVDPAHRLGKTFAGVVDPIGSVDGRAPVVPLDAALASGTMAPTIPPVASPRKGTFTWDLDP